MAQLQRKQESSFFLSFSVSFFFFWFHGDGPRTRAQCPCKSPCSHFGSMDVLPLSSTMCVRWYSVLRGVYTTRCHVCYWCLQDERISCCLDVVGNMLFENILSFGPHPSTREHWTTEELENALEWGYPRQKTNLINACFYRRLSIETLMCKHPRQHPCQPNS